MSDPLLSIEALTIEAIGNQEVRRQEPRLLNELSLSIESGEVLGVIGESGAGKSTLGLAAMGYIRPGCRIAGGRVSFGGRDILTLPPKTLRRIRGARISYIAQSPAASLNPAKRLGDQVAEALFLHRGVEWKEAKTRAASLFEELGLPSPGIFGDRFPHQVSGGQLQRAMIAMALICAPQLLILDEPTTALDVTTQIEVLAVIRATLRRHAISAIYITHDLALVAQLADRLLVLRHGRMVETGTTEDILRHPVRDYTRRLIATHERPAPLPPAEVSNAPIAREPSALAIDALSASYRELPNVLRDISLNLDKGKTLAIVGTSGSGKSTLARVICGLQPQSTGTISLFGEPLPSRLRDRSAEQLRRIQLVYQLSDTALNPGQPVGFMLGRAVSFHFGGRRAKVRARVEELLDMVGLSRSLVGRKPSQLSGGQKQRIGIARALAACPEVIICDEITSSLDSLIAEDILALLRQLQRTTGAAYIFITHDIGVVRRIADDVAVLRSGNIVAKGSIDDVFSPPYHPYTQLLLSSVPEMRTDWLTDVLKTHLHRPSGEPVALIPGAEEAALPDPPNPKQALGAWR